MYMLCVTKQQDTHFVWGHENQKSLILYEGIHDCIKCTVLVLKFKLYIIFIIIRWKKFCLRI